MADFPREVVERAERFSVDLSPVADEAAGALTAVEAARLAIDRIQPTQELLVVMSRRWIPGDRRVVWWLVQDGVEWAHTTPAPRPGEVPQPAALVQGQAIVAVDASTGEQVFSGVWGSDA